jgi:hypothetical protein
MSRKVYLRPSGYVAFLELLELCGLTVIAQVSAMTVAFGRLLCTMANKTGALFLGGLTFLFRFGGPVTFE